MSCSCPQPVCQPSLPACPQPISGPIGGSGPRPIIVNCADGMGRNGCNSGPIGMRHGGGGGGQAEHVINVVLVQGNDGGCTGESFNKGEGGCVGGGDQGNQQQEINVVLNGDDDQGGLPKEGNGGGGGYASSIPQPATAGCDQKSSQPCDIVVEHVQQGQGQSQQQYVPNNGGTQQQSGGYVQKQEASAPGYAAQQQVGVEYASQQQQLPPSDVYNAPQSPVQQPVQSNQYQQGAPVPAPPGPIEQSYQPPTSQVQPAASESENNYIGGENVAAAGDRLQEVQEDVVESKTGNNVATLLPNPTSITPSTVSVSAAEANFQIETSTQQLLQPKLQQKASDEQHDVFIEPVDINLLKLTNDTECNNEELRTIIKKNLPYELNITKRQIQLQAEARFGGRFDVICSHHDFSYITNTELWCQETQEGKSCYAYRQLGY